MYISFFSGDPSTPSPTEQFLISRYGKNLNSKFSDEIKAIAAKWQHALNVNGEPDGQSICTCQGYSFLKIKAKKGKVAIRFPFYKDRNNGRLVILLGYFKIVPYKGGKETDKMVHKKEEEAQLYFNEYKENNNKFKVSQVITEILPKKI